MPRAIATGPLQGIAQIAVNVKDLERAQKFYKDNLQLKFLFTAGKMSFFECNDVRIMLGIPEKPEFDHPSSIIYFKVSDIHLAHQEMLSRKVHFEAKPFCVAKLGPTEIWMSFFRGSESNLMAITSEVGS